MKSIRMLRTFKEHLYNQDIPMRPTLVIELSFGDIIRMLLGQELLLSNKSTEFIVLRNGIAYEALNMEAPKA